MNQQITKLQLFIELQHEFNKRYPFLKVEWRHKPDEARMNTYVEDNEYTAASDFLTKCIGLNDNMTIIELDNCLQKWLGGHITILRKSYSGWIEVNMTGEWSLRRHNNHGRDVSTQFH